MSHGCWSSSRCEVPSKLPRYMLHKRLKEDVRSDVGLTTLRFVSGFVRIAPPMFARPVLINKRKGLTVATVVIKILQMTLTLKMIPCQTMPCKAMSGINQLSFHQRSELAFIFVIEFHVQFFHSKPTQPEWRRAPVCISCI